MWRQRAACRDDAGARLLMFSARPALAAAVCATCAPAGPCLLEALAEECGAEYRYGVRGGLTGSERESLAAGGAAGVDAFVRFAGRRAVVA